MKRKFYLSTFAFLISFFSYAQTSVLSLDDISVKPGEEATLNISMENDCNIQTMDLSILLPEGLSFVMDDEDPYTILELADRKWPGCNIEPELKNNGQLLQTVIFSPRTNGYVQPGSGPIFTFRVKVAENAVPEVKKITLTGIIMNTPVPDVIKQKDVTNNVTIYITHSISATSANETMGTVSLPGAGKEVISGTTLIATATPNDGYEFVNWTAADTEVSTENPYSFTASADLALVGNFKAKKYEVRFVFGNGTEDQVQTLDFGSVITAPANPTKTGYTFAGWSPTFEEGATVPVDGITYTAQWTINQYTITFDTDGGSEIAPITQDYNSAVTAPADPTKTGYTFAGWDKEIPTTMPAEDITIKALWTINQYTITFDTDGGSEIAPITQDYNSAVTAPANPTKTGYTFAGWDKEIPATMPAENLTIKALWTINQYTITFDTDGGSEIAPITQDYNSTVTAPANPTKTGYTFAGWDKEIPATMPAEDITIKALWTINQYTITFDTDGGSEIAPITQDYNSAVTAPADPTKTGYTFAGWDKEIPATIPAEDITIKALWTINQYTITFDTDGGSEIAPITQDYNSPVTAPANPTKIGYTFAGWNKEIPATMPAENITIKALWTINQYTITFDTDGGSEIAPITQDYNSAVTAPADPTKTGYTFAGWDKEIPATMPAEDITIKALWTINQYTITFDTDGGSEIAPITQDYNSAVTAPANPTKIGYTFAGWDKEIPATMPAENLTIKALWTINQYTITFDTDGGSKIAPIIQDYNSPVTAPANPAKTGYTFAGWNKEIPATMPAENLTIKALWTINQYTITFDTDGGSEIAPITQDYNSAVTAPADPTKTGHTFAGWDKEIPATMPAGDITIKALWTINQYTITFDTDGGSEIAPITQDYNSTVTAPANPAKTGYTFAGWDKEIPATMPAEDITIKALWTINKYMLTYKVDGDVYKQYEIEYKAAITPEDAPVKEGHTFSGWSEIPATMPANDIEVNGTFTINQYKVTFVVDGEVIKQEILDFGAIITVPENPIKIGYTFTGWSPEVDAIVPSHDVIYEAQFEINTYKLTYYIDGELYKKFDIEYNSVIIPEAIPVKEGYDFSGWSEIPQYMPDHNVDVYGKFTISTGINNVKSSGSDERIYDLSGNVIKSPKKGVYIINGKKILIK